MSVWCRGRIDVPSDRPLPETRRCFPLKWCLLVPPPCQCLIENIRKSLWNPWESAYSITVWKEKYVIEKHKKPTKRNICHNFMHVQDVLNSFPPCWIFKNLISFNDYSHIVTMDDWSLWYPLRDTDRFRKCSLIKNVSKSIKHK